MSKSQVNIRSTITLLLGTLTNLIPDIMASFGNNIFIFNKDLCSFGTVICARGEDLRKLLPQIFATYADCSSYNGPFTRYIDILGNQ